MSIWSPSDVEKENILNQHNTPYNGYATLKQNSSNQIPLTVQDFAKDKQGMTVGNNGKVLGFTNVGINESVHEEMCEQCGGTMMENVCEQCGSMNEQMYGQRLDVEQDLDPKAGFDYVQGSSNDVDTFEGMHKNLYKKKSVKEQYDEVDSAYDFQTDGPEEFNKKTDFDSINQEYQLQQDELDYESQHDTDSEARDMIARMNKMMNKEYDGQEKWVVNGTLIASCQVDPMRVIHILTPLMVKWMRRKCSMKVLWITRKLFWRCSEECPTSKILLKALNS